MSRNKYKRQACQGRHSNNNLQQVSRAVKTATQALPSSGRDSEGDQNNDSTRRDQKKRLHQWQRIHIGVFMGAFLCSLAGVLAFGMVLKNFEVYCPLFANVSVIRDEEVAASNASAPRPVPYYSVDYATSSWGGKWACEFCLFTTVSSFIYAFLWLWIFCSFSRKVQDMSVVRESAPWKIVPPALFITCVFSMLVLTCAILLTVGQATLCDSLERHTLVSCSDAQDLPWKPDVIKMANFYTLLTRAEVAIWLAAICWSLNSALLCCRCVLHPDVATTASVVPGTATTATA
ncbi:transmembrane protein 179B-like isoform X1 [Dermacentor variabilis]|uniref:transmembrane protein 179B-like isoform X1 n=1 Tax=Dermacentor variabilis TaxID=34621 RepID=UPI003F5C6EF6